MRFHVLCLAMLGSLVVAACSNQQASTSGSTTAGIAPVARNTPIAQAPMGHSEVAGAADSGALFAYAGSDAIQRGASTLYPIELSEAHALNALTRGEMALPLPNGDTMRVRTTNKVVHEDGNWTLLGKGATPGSQAVLTFGDKAVFGALPSVGKTEYRITTDKGRAYLVATDTSKLPAEQPGTDYIEATNAIAAVVPSAEEVSPVAVAEAAASRKNIKRLAAAAQASSKIGVQEALVSGWPTIDIALGYTNGFADRLGGQSQAVTRLRFLVDLANQLFVNSAFQGQFRLVRTVQVNYTDTNTNRAALFQLTGVSCTNSTTGSQLPDGGVTCTSATVPAALQPLRDARETYGADLVALVRNFNSPENQSCGIGWLNGGGQSTFDQADADFGFAVISDTNGSQFPDPEGSSNTCREDGLAHELGHTLGLQHDRDTAAETDDSNSDGNLLDPEEFGAFPWAFGYSSGTFYTVMSVRRAGQSYFATFSNPDTTFCGGAPCGIVDQADNVRALESTFAIAANFRATIVDFVDVPSDYWAFQYVRKIANSAITSGCAINSPEPPSFCPEAGVTREQMAVFLVRGMHGSGFVPPAAVGTFSDVPVSSPFAPWIEQLARDGVTSGCGNGAFCPASVVSRDTMAVFLLRAKYGAAFSPAPATGVFGDVPTNNAFAPWIEKLFADGVTGGCQASPAMYCPTSEVTRAQMAVFLSLSFGL